MALKISNVRELKDSFSFNKTKFNKHTADVAVIMPCNNRLKYAVQAIISVLNQDYENLALICVGRPSDGVRLFLEQMSDDRVIYLIHDNPTLASCTNAALKYVECELPNVKYFTRCDDDDWLAKDKVRKCRNYLRMNPQVDLVHHGYHITNESGQVTNLKKMIFNQEDLLEYSNIYDGTIMFRAHKDQGSFIYLNESLPGLPFYDWFIRLHQAGWKMEYVNYNGYYYRQWHSNNVRRVDIEESYKIIRDKNDIKLSDHECDVMFQYVWLGRESGITASVNHCSSLLEGQSLKVKVHASPDTSLYGLKLRALLCRPKLIIIENMDTPTDAFIDLMNTVSEWGCQVVIREHGKAAFSPLFWGKLARHDRVIQLASWFSKLHVASVNEQYARYLSQLYDDEVLWVPNTFNKHLMVKQPKVNDEVDVSILCEIRPLKNMITQLCACQLLGKWLKGEGKELNVHLLNSRGGKAFIDNLRKNSDKLHFNLRIHPYMSFKENQRLVSRMDLALQVSYTETMNYYALEHLMHGIPAITSEVIPFGDHAPIDNPFMIAQKAYFWINKELKDNYSIKIDDLIKDAEDYVKNINEQFIKLVEVMLK